jgi:hypothetical protein
VSLAREPLSSKPAAIVTIPDAAPVPGGEPLHTVHVLAAPLQLWDDSSEHTAELMREFALLSLAAQERLTREVPAQLVELVADLRAALDAGEQTRDFRYEVPASVTDVCRTLLQLLDQADDYCAGGALINGGQPTEQWAFRHWYLGEFVAQLGGRPPRLGAG